MRARRALKAQESDQKYPTKKHGGVHFEWQKIVKLIINFLFNAAAHWANTLRINFCKRNQEQTGKV